jgi:hypothetical protein
MEQGRVLHSPATTPRKAAATVAVTVLLTNEQIAQVDELTVVIRRNSGKAESRSALIRVLLDAPFMLRADWKHCRDADEVCLAVLSRQSSRFDLEAGLQKLRLLKSRSEASSR